MFAAGNEGTFNDSCTYDGYATSIHTISVSSINPDGNASFITERCPSIMAVTYTKDGSAGFNDKTFPMVSDLYILMLAF